MQTLPMTGQGAARVDRLARRFRPGRRPTFHAFRYRDVNLVYDLLTGSILEPTDPVFAILEGIEKGDRATEIIASAGVPEPELDGMLDELEQLHEAGFFRSEESSRAQDLERLVADGLMAHHPRKMMLMVQSNCNLRCTYCYEVSNGFHGTGSRMDRQTGIDSIELLIERSGERKELEITFFGGEPLMNFPLIGELVEYCRARGEEIGKRFHFQLTTNATLLTDEIISFLVANEFTVMVSIDGPPEKNDLHRVDLGGRGTGAVALANARKLVAAQREAGLREAMVRATMTHENHDAEALEAFFHEQGFARVMLGVSSGRADGKEPWDVQTEDVESMSESGSRAIDAYADWVRGQGERPTQAGSVERGLHEIMRALTQPTTAPSVRCGVGRNMQAVSRDGKIYPCHRYAGDEAFLLGTLEEGLDEQKLRDYYDALLRVKEEHCSSCWARITCGGQCPWYISNAEGEILHPDEESCDGIRNGHERLLYAVHELRKAGRIGDLRSGVSE